MHFHRPIPKCFEENFVSHSEGPNEQFGMNLKGPTSARYIVPQPLPGYFPSFFFKVFMYIHEYVNEMI